MGFAAHLLCSARGVFRAKCILHFGGWGLEGGCGDVSTHLLELLVVEHARLKIQPRDCKVWILMQPWRAMLRSAGIFRYLGWSSDVKWGLSCGLPSERSTTPCCSSPKHSTGIAKATKLALDAVYPKWACNIGELRDSQQTFAWRNARCRRAREAKARASCANNSV